MWQDILFGDQSKTYWVDDTVDPKEFDEDELAEEKARRGQYSVIAKLFECVPEAREAKAHLDKIIDLCGEPATGGKPGRRTKCPKNTMSTSRQLY